jgi:hypothetical protein
MAAAVSTAHGAGIADPEVSADLPGHEVVNLTVAWDRRPPVVRLIHVDGVLLPSRSSEQPLA